MQDQIDVYAWRKGKLSAARMDKFEENGPRQMYFVVNAKFIN